MFRCLKIFIALCIIFSISSLSVKAEIVDGIIAIVNNEVITQGELNQILLPIYTQYKSTYTDEELLQKLDDARRNILYQLIEDKLILQEAKRVEVVVDDKEVSGRMEQIKSQFADADEFKEALKSQNLTISDLKDKYREQIMIKRLIDYMVRSKVEIAPTEASRYYEEHRNEFKVPRQLMVKTILIRKAGENPESQAELQKKIKEIHKKIKEGSDFSKIAREYSEDPSAVDGGDMGYIEKGQMMKKIDDLLFSLEPEEISDVIETGIGYHIFQVVEIKEAEVRPFKEVRLSIKEKLFQEKARDRMNEWMNSLKENAYISIK
ncbi:MAG: peptidylprolyl isomerase [Candidatus Omnitrophica bacterium]|nr:peptidylprolyl isomerase [Candidatus Omnitrophota bacterium]